MPSETKRGGYQGSHDPGRPGLMQPQTRRASAYCYACKRHHEAPVASFEAHTSWAGIVSIRVKGECPNPHCYCGRPVNGLDHIRCSQAGCQHPVALEANEPRCGFKHGDPLPDEDEPNGPTRASWQRGALSALRRAEVELGAAQHQLRNAGLPASMRAVERTKERVTRLRHNIEDGKKR